MWLLPAGGGCWQAVLFSFLFIDLLCNKLAFHSTQDSGTVCSRDTSGCVPHFAFASSDRLNLGVADSRIFLGRGPGVGRAAEPSATPGTMQLAGGWVSKAGGALLPSGKIKKTQLYLHIGPACKAMDSQCPFEMRLPKVFSVPLPRICVPIVCGSEWCWIASWLERGVCSCCRRCLCWRVGGCSGGSFPGSGVALASKLEQEEDQER